MMTPTSDVFTCPWTNTKVTVSIPPQKSAAEFCPDCDFPMFWMRAVQAATKEHLQKEQDSNEAQDKERSEQAERAAGLKKQRTAAVAAGFIACRSCDVLQHRDRKYCSNCGAAAAEEQKPPASEKAPVLEFDWRPLAFFVLVVVASVVGAAIWLDLF